MENEVVVTQTFKKGDILCEKESTFIAEEKKCPDCKTGQFMKAEKNLEPTTHYCANIQCGSKFKFMGGANMLMFVERTSDAQPNKLKS